jgi:hypothetical protein
VGCWSLLLAQRALQKERGMRADDLPCSPNAHTRSVVSLDRRCSSKRALWRSLSPAPKKTGKARRSVLVEARSERPISPRTNTQKLGKEETSKLGGSIGTIAGPVVDQPNCPRTPPGVGKRQGGPSASCARGRRHTGNDRIYTLRKVLLHARTFEAKRATPGERELMRKELYAAGAW